MNTTAPSLAAQHVVVTSTKSVGIQILLIIFLGSLGLFYSSIKGALIILLGLPALFAVFATMLVSAGSHGNADAAAWTGLGGLLLMIPVMWMSSFVWGVVAVKAHNRTLMSSVHAYA